MERYGEYPYTNNCYFRSISHEEPEREESMYGKDENLKPQLPARSMKCPGHGIFPELKKCLSREYAHIGVVLDEVSRSENQICYYHESERHTEEAQWT